MQVPVPTNKLVAFTLAGALLTAIVAGALAMPGGGLTQSVEQDPAGTTTSDASQQLASDAPTPNQDFTPAVQTQSGYEDEEHEEHEDEYEGEDEDEDEDEDEYEEEE